MSWRIILITKACKLSILNNQLVYKQENEEELQVPLEDISAIVFDTKQINITGYLLSQIAENKISILTTNDSHIPNGIFLPYISYYKNSDTVYLQQQWSEPFKKKLWQKIIIQKIINQALSIKDTNLETYKYILNLSNKVLSGDTKNIEALSASEYFRVFYNNFKRHSKTKINSALNYSYSIIRSLLAKNISAIGFIPCFGIHHCNKLNSFNLVDDMIEPFRPIIDYNIKQIYKNDYSDTELTTKEKAKLIEIMFYEISYNNENYNIMYTTQLVAENLLNITKTNNPKNIILPTFSNNFKNNK